MKKINIFVLCLALIGMQGELSAQNFAKYAGEFLAFGVGARAQALGGAFVSIADDATASYWNPAGLSQLDNLQIALMHSEQFAGEVNYDFASISLPYHGKTSFGLSLIRLGVDGIPDTRNALIDSVNLNGEIDEGERLNYDKITYFSNADYSLFLSVSHKKSEKFSLGANAKVIIRDFGPNSAWGFGFDIGMLYMPTEALSFGLNIVDATSTMIVWDTGTKELISPMFRLGSSYLYKMPSFGLTLRPVVSADVRFEGREYASQFSVGPISIDTHVGTEIEIKESISLRAGVDELNAVSFGIGVKVQKFNIDYSFTGFDNFAQLGNTHRVSLVIGFNDELFRRKR